jgi:hypothetical protein
VREIVSAPWPGRTLPGPSRFRTVITCEDKNGVVAHAECSNRVENFSNMAVHFGERIGEVTLTSLPRELRIWQRRKVDESEWNIGVERFAGRHTAFHEIDGSTRALRVDQPTLL